MEFGKWIKTSEQLPPEPKDSYGDNYLATVINEQVVPVRYVKITVRGKEVIRWEHYGKICPWNIIAYMSYPNPYQE